jgi:hypothetical protein
VTLPTVRFTPTALTSPGIIASMNASAAELGTSGLVRGLEFLVR